MVESDCTASEGVFGTIVEGLDLFTSSEFGILFMSVLSGLGLFFLFVSQRPMSPSVIMLVVLISASIARLLETQSNTSMLNRALSLSSSVGHYMKAAHAYFMSVAK